MSDARSLLSELVDDFAAERAGLRQLVADADPRTPTPAPGWDVRDNIAHLVFIDNEARAAVRDPSSFTERLRDPGLDTMVERQVAEGRTLTWPALLDRWDREFPALIELLRPLDPSSKLPWYGPPMSPASFVTARLMEYWAHGEDVATALGVRRQPTARLRHIVRLGVRTRGWSYRNRGLPAPAGDVAVRLTAPDGSVWQFGNGTEVVEGPALDFCLLVTQRRNRADLTLRATGPLADEWLDIAQCYAGPPGSGRPAGG